MKALSVKIRIGGYEFTHAANIAIESSWDELSDRCTIELPALGRFSGNPGAWQGVGIKPGDAVSVHLGYDGHLLNEFEGYVASFDPKIPYTIECEGESYLLKRAAPIKKSWRSISIKTLLAEVLKGFDAEIHPSVPDVALSPFSIPSATPAEVLRKLADEYIFAAYFRGRKLFVGLPYTELMPSAYFHLQGMDVASADGLRFRLSDQVRLKAKAVSILKDNRRIEATAGDADGEQRTLFFRGIESASALKSMAEAELKRLKYDGYEGSFDALGVPYISHGWTAEVEDQFFPERKGKYLVDKTSVSFGTGGFRRVVTLGKKV